MAAGVEMLRHCVLQVDRAGVFSSNEEKDDIATADLKYMLTPFYLSEVVSRTRTPDPATRLPIVTEAAENTELFLAMCDRHGFLPDAARAAREREGTVDPATFRAEKVNRFKRDKAIRVRLEELDAARRKRREAALMSEEVNWDGEDDDEEDADSPLDDEEERERWLLLVEVGPSHYSLHLAESNHQTRH